MTKPLKKSLHWLISHVLTVFSCVAIIALGMAAIAYSNPGTTTIGENISTGGTLTVFSNANLATTTISGGDLIVDTDTLFVDSTNNRVGIGTASPDATVEIRPSTSYSGNLTEWRDTDGSKLTEIGPTGEFSIKKDKSPQVLVTFSFDDTLPNADTKAMMDTQGEVGTVFYITGSSISDSVATQLLQYQQDGWEIGSHTKTHPNLTTLTEEELEEELKGSKDLLEEKGITVRNFASPYGSDNAFVRKIERKYYRSTRYAGANYKVSNGYPLKTYKLDSYDYSADSALLEEYKAAVDQAESEGKYLIFYTHADAWTTSQINTTSALIDYIQSKNIPIVTVDQGLDLLGNAFDYKDAVDGVSIGADGSLRVGSGLYANSSTGRVGIATTSPIAKLAVVENIPGGSTVDSYGIYVSRTGGGTPNNLTHYGGYYTNSLIGSSHVYGYGLYAESIKTGSYGIISAGVKGNGRYNGTALYGDLLLFGVWGHTQIDGNTTASPIKAAYSLYSSGSINSNLTSYYGLYIATPSGAGSIINKYGIYQQSSDFKNYFAGNVGIGTTTPALKLDLYGGAMRAFNTASSTCDSTTRGSTFYNEANDSFWGCKTTGWVRLDN